jgi:hypothetical protein
VPDALRGVRFPAATAAVLINRPMLDLRKLFVRHSRVPAPAPGPDADATSRDGDPTGGLDVEYQQLVTAQLARSGISLNCATVEVRRLGRSPDGFDVFVGMVRLHRWERRSALRLLVGLPLLEKRVRRVVRSSWLADYSHFGGLWLHASEQLEKTTGPRELRQLLMALTASSPADDASQPAERDSIEADASLG